MVTSAPAQAGDEAADLWQELRRKRPWSLRRRHVPWVALLALAAALRLMGLGSTGVWHDEAMSIHTARMGTYEQTVDMSVANNQPPLFFLLLKLWAVVSWSSIWLRLMSVLVSLAGVVFAVRWLRLWDGRAGWAAGLLVATSPLMIHYAQEIRAYALLYTCTLAGLYCGERVARDDPRRARVGLLAWACAASYAHYTGLLIAAALWVYTWLRGGGLWRTAVLAAAWAALVVPILVLGASHAADKAETGYWIDPLTGGRMLELVAEWTGHAYLQVWQAAGSGPGRAWAALGLSALLAAGLGLAMITSAARGEPQHRRAAGAMFATAAVHAVLVAVISLAVVAIALERTTFPAFIPLIGLMAMSCTPAVRGWIRVVGVVSCLLVAAIWMFTWPARVYASPERRPAEQTLFEAIAERLQPGDVVMVFPADLQASAGYFLRDRAGKDQIHSTDFPRLGDAEDGLRLLAIPRKRNSAWFVDFRAAVGKLRRRHPKRHGVWVVDLGPRSAGDPDRKRVREWLEHKYTAADAVACGDRWTLAAQYYLPKITEANGAYMIEGAG